MIGKIWTIFFILSVVFGISTGRMNEVSQAAATGAGQAVELIIGIVGTMMLLRDTIIVCMMQAIR